MSWLWCIGIAAAYAFAYQTDAVHLRSQYACQDKKLRIKCNGDGEEIVVKHAIFGRKTTSKCWKWYSYRWRTDCAAPRSLYVVKTVCDGKPECSLYASYGVFQGDPCDGTEKYLQVDYICKAPRVTFHKVTACQYSDARLACSGGTKIRTVSVFYGRKNRNTCRKPYSIVWNTSCKARSAIRIVRALCDDKSECTVYATTSVLETDPCPYTSKYLTIKYLCAV